MGLQQFQEFINLAHEVINKVRSKYVRRMFHSVLLFLAWVLMFDWQHLCEKLGSAMEPGVKKEVMLGEAQGFLNVSL